MQEYIPPFLFDLYVRAYDDIFLRCFCIAIIGIGILFFLRTASNFFTLKRDIDRLHKSLEKQLGADDMPVAHFANQIVSAETRDGDIRKLFRRAGLERQWKRFDANLVFFVDRDVPQAQESVVTNLFSGAALERSKISLGTAGRGAFLTAMGVLGTFSGLVIGVSAAGQGLASNDVEIARRSLSELLAGAELAFITSILGLVLSLLHGLLLNACRRRMYKSAQDLCDYLYLAFNARAGEVRIIRAMNTVRAAIEDASADASKERAHLTEGVGLVARGIGDNMKLLSSLNATADKLLTEKRHSSNEAAANIVGHLQSVSSSLGSIHGHTSYVAESMYELRGRSGKSPEREKAGAS